VSNRSAVFAAAWKSYRVARPALWATGDDTGERRFLPELFARVLRTAWADARKADATARRFLELQHQGRVAVAAAMEPVERSAAISRAREELTTLDYAPLGVRTSQRRADLRATLSALTAA
jgi:hypothetical protein